MEAAQAILRKYWGYPSFRPLQERVIRAVGEKKDVLALMPTGGGKSICFQVPALLQKGVCLVVSPLIALMQDQVATLRRQGISAAALYTGMSHREMDIILDHCVYEKIKLLYLSPERLHTDLFQQRVKKMNVSFLVVDEAHCISQWGHDFRPAYHRIAKVKSLLPKIYTLALTATATDEVKEDIIQKLTLDHPLILQASFARPNIAFKVQRVEERGHALYQYLQKTEGSTIVYASTRKETQWMAHYLEQKGVSTTYYHAGLSSEERTRRQQAWFQDAVRVMVATNAFGMGIDKANVRLVVHLHFPNTLEAYYQEAGRAGRDEEPACAAVLYEAKEIELLAEKVDRAHPDALTLKMIYQKLANYYQIAVGSHADVTYSFDPEDFSKTYDLKISHVYTAFQRFQEANLIQYDDRFAQPAQIHITTGSQQLYAFQVRNPAYHPLIRALNQCYGTYIFTKLTQCSLKRLSKYLQTSEGIVHRHLKEIHDLGILTYIPEKKHPTLTFLTPRYAMEDLPIHTYSLAQRKNLMKKKAGAVIHYMTHTQRCRMQLLLEYLGEVSYDRCGICDICTLSHKPVSKDAATRASCRKKIKAVLKQTSLTPKNLVKQLSPEIAEKDIIETLRLMLSHNELAYTDSFKLILVHKYA